MAKIKVSVSSICNAQGHEASLREAVRAVWNSESKVAEGEISVALVPRALMQRLNYSYKGKDSVTDVLAFPISDDVGRARGLRGEIVICPDVAASQARERGHSIEEELIVLTVHGALHLLGYLDGSANERREMKSREKFILRLLGQDECTAD